MLSRAIKACGQSVLGTLRCGLMSPAETIDLSTAGCVPADSGTHPFSPTTIASHTAARFKRQDNEALFRNMSRNFFGMPYLAVSSGFVGAANLCVYRALLRHGDSIIHMPVEGHDFSVPTEKTVSSGVKVRIIGCPVRSNGLVDYNKLDMLTELHNPKIIVASYELYSRCLDIRRLKQIAEKVGATLLVDVSAVMGLILCGLLPSPSVHADILTCSMSHLSNKDKSCLIFTRREDHSRLINAEVNQPPSSLEKENYRLRLRRMEYAKTPDFFEHQHQALKNARAMCEVFTTRGVCVVGGGTDTTFFLINLRPLKLTAQQALLALEQTGISARADHRTSFSRNEFDSDFLLLNASAITARGMSLESCRSLTEYICEILRKPMELKTLARSAKGVEEISSHYPTLGYTQKYAAFQ